MPAPSYIASAVGLQRGIGADEVGLKVSSVTTTIENEKEFCYSRHGTRNGFATGFDPQITIDFDAELAGTTGVAAAAFGTAITLLNNDSGMGNGTTYAGITDAGGWYLDGSLTITESRDGFKSFSASFIKLPEID